MKKDIEIPIVKDVFVAVVHEWDKDFTGKDWNAYIINNRETAIDMVLIVSKGYFGDRKTSTMRHGIGKVEAKSFEKIEMMTEDVIQLNNEFYVTFFANDKLFEKKYIFRKNSISESKLDNIPVLENDGVLAE